MEITRMEGQLVKFPTKDKLELQGFLTTPRGAKTCIVHLHGMTGSFYDSRLAWHLADYGKRKRVAVFLFNNRGHDMVSGIDMWNRKKHGPIAGTDFERFEDCIIDIDSTLSFLKKLGFKRFILSGHSTGCQKIAYYQYKRKNRRVNGLVLLGAASDSEISRKELGKKFNAIVAYAKRMVKNRKGNVQDSRIPDHFTAKRWLSANYPENPEARIFDYYGKLAEFGKITVPILAVFGSKEQHVTRPVKWYLDMLEERTHSSSYTSCIVKGANHSFHGHERELASLVVSWAAGIR